MNITDFKANLAGGGARGNHFSVMLTMPPWVNNGLAIEASREAQFLCHGASLPASTLSDVEVGFRGRIVHVAGERTFEPWVVQIYNDTSFNIRDNIESWIEGISNTTQTNGIINPSAYQSQMQVYQYDRNGAVIKEYNFVNAYPTSIGEIELSYENSNQIETFSVNFTYDFWTTNTTAGHSGFSINTSIQTPFGVVNL